MPNLQPQRNEMEETAEEEKCFEDRIESPPPPYELPACGSLYALLGARNDGYRSLADEESIDYKYEDEDYEDYEDYEDDEDDDDDEEKSKYQTSIYRTFKLNIPWLIMFTMDVIGTSNPNSKLYKYWINLDREGTSGYIDAGGALFALIYIMAGYLTLCANLKFFIDYRYERRSGTYWDRKHSAAYKALRWFLLAILFVPLVPGIFIYSCAAIKIHSAVGPDPPTCHDQGFPASILLQVNNGKGLPLTYRPYPNNLTISSGHSTFGLNLLPTIMPQGRDIIDFQLATSRDITTSNLFLRIRNEYVLIQLDDHTYEFGYTQSGSDSKKGNFTGNRSREYSFPTLDLPLHSMPLTRTAWTPKRPSVELVDNSMPPQTVLKTMKYRPRSTPCTELSLCGAWNVGEMLEDPEKMEAILVPLGMIMIEMAKYGLAEC